MNFTARLNKRDSPYVIADEVFSLTGGKGAGYLAHDNVNPQTVEVFTAPLRQGEKILTYTAEAKVDTPWKTYLIVFADAEQVYVHYETKGDTVEADDVNELQQAAVNADAEIKRNREGLQGHFANTGNPHQITKAQVGLSHADDTSDMNKPVSAAQEAAIGSVAGHLNAHKSDQTNAHRVTKAQVGLGDVDNVQQATKAEFNRHDGDQDRHMTAEERAAWNDKYTKNEVDNKFSRLESSIDWKESVATLTDIAAAYPTPEDGWTVNVKDTNYTYRYSGAAWIAISANAIPKATPSVDGLLAKEDKAKLNGIAANANNYVHPPSHPAGMITGLAAVATSGNYKDLTNKPSSGLPDSGVTWNQLRGV